MKAVWNGAVIAESDETVRVAGNHYSPDDARKREFVRPSEHRTTCPWNGTAQHCTLHVNSGHNQNAVWYYPTPKAGMAQVAGRVAFRKGVQVSA